MDVMEKRVGEWVVGCRISCCWLDIDFEDRLSGCSLVLEVCLVLPSPFLPRVL